VSAATDVGVPLSVIRISEVDGRDVYEADLVLIRPDQVIAWRGSDDKDAMNVIAQICGHAVHHGRAIEREKEHAVPRLPYG
jgi:hypothetical protein